MPAGAPVSLRSAHGTYLSAWDDGSVRQAPHCKGWEIFLLAKTAAGACTLRSAHGTFLSAWDDGSLRLQTRAGSWEGFEVRGSVVNPGRCTLQTSHGTFLSCPDREAERANQAPHAKAWEEFDVLAVVSHIQPAAAPAGGAVVGGGATTAAACGICEEAGATPLWCGHEFCSQCLGNWALSTNANRGKCPTCRQAISTVPVPVQRAPANAYYPRPARRGPVQYQGCFAGFAAVVLADGVTTKAATDLAVGDQLWSPPEEDENGDAQGRTVTVAARVSTTHATDPHPVIQYGKLLITQQHPIRIGGSWTRPLHAAPTAAMCAVARHCCIELVNLVTEPRAPIVVDGVVVSTLGLHCLGVDDGASSQDTTSVYGSERVVESLKQDPMWPDIRRRAGLQPANVGAEE